MVDKKLLSELVFPGDTSIYEIETKYIKGKDPDTWLGRGQPNGVAPLDDASKIPAAYLPAYVDDVVEFKDFASLPETGETGKIYVTTDDNKTYRWSGSTYAPMSGSLALGKTESTAAPGNHTHTLIPLGSVASTFTGKQGKATTVYTPTGSINIATAVTEEAPNYVPAGTIKVSSITPAGSVASDFTGKMATITSKFTPSGTISAINYTPKGTVGISVGTGSANYTPAGKVTLTSATQAGTVASSFKGTETKVSLTYTPSGKISNVSFTPSGSVSAPSITVTPSSTKFKAVSSVGTLPSHSSSSMNTTYDSENKMLTLSFTPSTFNAGTLTTIKEVSVMTGASATASAPTFSGTVYNVTPTFTGNQEDVSATFTPQGSVTSTFSGTPHTHTATFNGTGVQLAADFTGEQFSVTPTFSGSENTATATYTPAGTVGSSFSGTASTPTASFSGEGVAISGQFSGTETTLESSYTPVGEVASTFSGSSTKTTIPN